MKPASVNDIKKELQQVKPSELLEICLRLARFKKENKELITFLLFDAHDLPGYVASVKEETEEMFAGMNKNQVYLAKKTIRKALRNISKHCRYMGNAEAEIELLLHFCNMLRRCGIPLSKAPVLANLYAAQLKKINQLISKLHEDLQYDYRRQWDVLLKH